MCKDLRQEPALFVQEKLDVGGGVMHQWGWEWQEEQGVQARPLPSPIFPTFQPLKAPVMLWDESSFPNTSRSVSSSKTVKVRDLDGQGLTSSGWAGGP